MLGFWVDFPFTWGAWRVADTYGTKAPNVKQLKLGMDVYFSVKKATETVA